MSNNNGGLIGRFQTLKPVFSAARANEFFVQIGHRTEAELESNYVDSPMYGQALLFTDVPVDGKNAVVEIMISPKNGDSLVSMYEPHEVFNDRHTYKTAREELICCIEDMKQASPGTLGVKCPSRKRSVGLRDLPILQLVAIMNDVAGKFAR